MMTSYPINLSLRGRKCVVVGGGRVAERKVIGLRDAGADVLIVSPHLTPGLTELSDTNGVTWIGAPYNMKHLDGAFLAFAATDDPEVNVAVVQDAGEQHIWVNSASDPDMGDFANPSIVRRGGLTLTASTKGGSPTLSAVVREELERHFGPEWDGLTALLSRLRPDIQTLDENARRAAVRRVLSDTEVTARLSENDIIGAETRARALVLQ